jgi:hypothetical protein
MTLTELIPGVQSLSYDDKILLLNLVTGELVKDAGLASATRQVPVTAGSGLHDSYEAAAVLAQFLADHQAANQ